MRVAVVGATGLVGRYTVDALAAAGHEPVRVARSAGVDVITGDGLVPALSGVDAVVDVTNTPETDPDKAREFFGTVSANLLAAEEQTGVRHHVLLSIVGVDRVEGNAHYAGKRRQEEVVTAGRVPYTIVRATQFYEFPDLLAGWLRTGDTVPVAPLLLQPVAARDVGQLLAEVAVGAPAGRVELAGPQPHDFVDMTRRVFAARGEDVTLAPTWRDAIFGVEMAGEVMLPGDGARIGPTTFDEWLAAQGR
ncbi:MAG TPA: NAD(P)H-binding protein [Jatrophihabitans sp.]|nr:NAD(P)H-binding protein [Jatrophihabitans sp.]